MADAKQFRLGAPYPLSPTATTLRSFQVAASNSAIEMIFNAQEAATITRLGYRLSSVAGTSPVYRISLQGVTSAGIPDGTVKGGGSPCSATFTPAGSNTWVWVNLANSYTCTRGELLALVIDYSSGTINGSNAATFSYTDSVSGQWGLPYGIQNNATVRTRQSDRPIFGYGSAGKAYGMPTQNYGSTAYSSDSTPDEFALRFIVPTTLCSTYQVGGLEVGLADPATGKTVKFVLYDGTTALQSVTWQSDVMQGTSGFTRYVSLPFTDVSLSTLVAGNVYRIGVQPQETANNVKLLSTVVTANADLDAYPMGLNWYSSSRTDLGAWTDDNLTRPAIGLVITDWTLPASASPGIITATG